MVLDAYLRSRIQNFSLPDRYQSLYSKQRNAGKSKLNEFTLFNSVADPGPGSCAFLTPGSGIRNQLNELTLFNSVADPGPGSGIRCLFDPWIQDPESVFPNPGSWISDPGSWISDPGSQTHMFEILVTIVWVKSSIFL